MTQKADNFKHVNFSEQEIATFNSTYCNGSISVSTDISNPDSPLWVNFVSLNNFIKLHGYHWGKQPLTDKHIAVEQRASLLNILLKINYVCNLALKYNCKINQWVDLRKLLNIVKTSKIANLYLATFPHHEYDILEIEKLGLEHSKIELGHDVFNETRIQDLIILSKLMAQKIHGLIIP
jgi:hypothetical protein